MKMWAGSGLLVAVAMMAGCATSGIEAIGKPTDPEIRKHLIIHNEPLADKITISEMRSRMAGDLMEVDVTLANLSSRDINLQYRFSWYDADDFEVEQGTHAWTPITLHGYANASVKAVAPNASVKTYKVNVRELR